MCARLICSQSNFTIVYPSKDDTLCSWAYPAKLLKDCNPIRIQSQALVDQEDIKRLRCCVYGLVSLHRCRGNDGIERGRLVLPQTIRQCLTEERIVVQDQDSDHQCLLSSAPGAARGPRAAKRPVPHRPP